MTEGVQLKAKYLDNVVQVLRSAISTTDNIDVIVRVHTLTVDNKGNITLMLDSGTEVRLGLSDNVEKMVRVKMAIRKLQNDNRSLKSIEYMDARSLDIRTGKGFVFRKR
jgi:cell division septal protein FtsQ